MSNIVEVINLNKSYKTKKSAQALYVLKDLNQKGTIVLVVTHDMDTAAYCTIVDGKVSEG